MKIRNRGAQQNGWTFRLRWSVAAILCATATPSEPRIVGRYVLETADGKTLPAVVAENRPAGSRLEVASGWMSLGDDRTFTWRTAYRITENGAVRTNESGGKGKYSLNGNALSLTPEDSSAVLEGTLTNGTLAIKVDVKLVYRREHGT